MARFAFVDYDSDDSSVQSVDVARNTNDDDGSCSLDSLDYSIDGDSFITDGYFSSDDETVASGESSSIVESLNDGNSKECFDEVGDIAISPPPVITVAVVDIVPPRRSSRSRRKPIRFADEYAKYYC